MISTQSAGQKNSTIGSFLKVTILWLLISYVVTMIGNALGLSTPTGAYFVLAGFAIHCLMTLFFLLGAPGSAWKLPLSLIAGVAIFFGLRATPTTDFSDMRESASQTTQRFVAWAEGKDREFRSMKAFDHLSAASSLVFERGAGPSVTQARRHLLAIPAGSAEYKSAQAMLKVAEAYARGSKAGPIEILRRDQKEDRLVITLRNNGRKPVKNIQYVVSYFEIPTGVHMNADTPLKIPKVIRPQETWTFEVPQDILRSSAHAAVALIDWEILAGS